MPKDRAPQLDPHGTVELTFRVTGGRGEASDSGANRLTISALLFTTSEPAVLYSPESPQETLNISIPMRLCHWRSPCSFRNNRPRRFELAAEVQLQIARMAASRGRTPFGTVVLKPCCLCASLINGVKHSQPVAAVGRGVNGH